MESLKDLLSKFKKDSEAAKKIVASLPKIIGTEAVGSIRRNFAIEGYQDGKSLTQWEKRKPSTDKAYDRRGSYKGSVFNSENPILRQTGNLKDSIKYQASIGKVRVGTNLDIIPYAQAHNEGLGHQPKRQFMPTPEEGLNENMRFRSFVKFKKEIENALKDLKL
jgi:phage gpG-like protein